VNEQSDKTVLEKFELGVRRGVAKALYEHKKNGRSIHIWRDGKVVEIPPEEINYNEDDLPPEL